MCRPYAGPLWVIRYALFLTSHLIHEKHLEIPAPIHLRPGELKPSRRNLKHSEWTEFDLNQSLLSRAGLRVNVRFGS